MPRFSAQPHRLAFTLIELLIVVGVIGILSGLVIVVINPNTQFAKARDSNRKKDLALISSALEQYYADNNAYPATQSGNSVSALPLAGSPKYIQSIPADPKSGFAYCYTSVSPYQTFNLCAKLESGADQLNGATTCTPTGAGGTGDYCLTNSF
ncbi:hypothetical protein CO058_00400 [candidate division WWE3 bacterium CG_4_9_14_0_2_um_filter_35_11]|uniref:Type II secretion system protein GspG C-terminal domain-containing protein n=1 Tax=candidate division WWE3 bacterium CG_4_9_14_0_2_um_filter_35_11 TaxID=1975077 RepID=A0A2M8EMP0_UNCKA|nr:MAG: hypothetical protein COV25_01650 [candidate division WWE3 bacterium CG10_big_fil_rev_8_21_14_0_10_35_32]PJC23999.1 MAG: hypothetical protein CO058_00400 [candidate division WWE3 bacterium CG_4_9_14_0_2_um_filter_35_11]